VTRAVKGSDPLIQCSRARLIRRTYILPPDFPHHQKYPPNSSNASRHHMMQWPTFLTLALTCVSPSIALLRFQCSQLVTQRLDPLVQPGMAPSTHVHQIVGGVSQRLHFSRGRVAENSLNRMHLMSRWIRSWIYHPSRAVQLAPSAKTFPTIGRPSSTSALGMAHTSAFLNYPRSVVLLEG